MMEVRHRSLRPLSFSKLSIIFVTSTKVFWKEPDPLPALAVYLVKYSNTDHKFNKALQSMFPRLHMSRCSSKGFNKSSLREKNKLYKPGLCSSSSTTAFSLNAISAEDAGTNSDNKHDLVRVWRNLCEHMCHNPE